MSVRVKWTIFIVICVIGIALLWYRQSVRTQLFDQIDSMGLTAQQPQIQATRVLLEKEIIPGALAAQPVIIRSKITKPLAEIKTPEAVAVLVTLLGDTEDAPRRWARNALIKIGPPALPELSQVLLEGDDNSKKMAVEALGQIGGTAVPYLRRLMADATGQANACIALGTIGTAKTTAPETAKEAQEALLQALVDPDTTLANAAIPVLGDQQIKVAVDPLRKALANAALQKTAIVALGEIADKRATPDLLPFIKNATLRIDTVRALAQIADPLAVPALTPTLGDHMKDYRSALVLALQRIGAPAATTLVGYLNSPDVYVRRAAMQSLRGDAVPSLIPILREKLANEPDAQVRAAAADALGWSGNTAAIEPLLAALKDKDGVVVDAAIGSLSEIGPGAIRRCCRFSRTRIPPLPCIAHMRWYRWARLPFQA